jgi:hypothetical protein
MLLLAGSGRLMVLDFEPSSADFPPTPAGSQQRPASAAG